MLPRSPSTPKTDASVRKVSPRSRRTGSASKHEQHAPVEPVAALKVTLEYADVLEQKLAAMRKKMSLSHDNERALLDTVLDETVLMQEHYERTFSEMDYERAHLLKKIAELSAGTVASVALNDGSTQTDVQIATDATAVLGLSLAQARLDVDRMKNELKAANQIAASCQEREAAWKDRERELLHRISVLETQSLQSSYLIERTKEAQNERDQAKAELQQSQLRMLELNQKLSSLTKQNDYYREILKRYI
jgi:hypothetical protein